MDVSIHQWADLDGRFVRDEEIKNALFCLVVEGLHENGYTLKVRLGRSTNANTKLLRRAMLELGGLCPLEAALIPPEE